MRIGLETWGTEGDVQPFLALARGLSAAGHRVTLVVTEITNKRFDRFGERWGFRVRHPGRINVDAAQYRDLASRLFLERNPVKRGDLVVRHFLDPVVEDLLRDGKALASESDLVVGHFFVYPLKIAAGKAGCPFAMLFTTPLVPTRYVPPMGIPETARWMNPVWWKVFDLALQWVWKPAMDRLYRREGVPVERTVLYDIWRSPLLNLVSTSPALFPPPPDWKGRVHLCGFMNLPDPEIAQEVPGDLIRFLEAGPPPVYMTFGSMLADDPDPRRITALLVEAAWLAGCRAIVQSNWNEAGDLVLPPDVFPVIRAPHARVFPACAAVVHHGGAGTTQTATRAGCPSIVVEHASDQPLWGALLHRRGLAPRVLHRRTVTAVKLARAVRQVMETPSMTRRAQAIGSRMGGEDGVTRGVSLIEDRLSRLS